METRNPDVAYDQSKAMGDCLDKMLVGITGIADNYRWCLMFSDRSCVEIYVTTGLDGIPRLASCIVPYRTVTAYPPKG